jgi:hypothetical protein
MGTPQSTTSDISSGTTGSGIASDGAVNVTANTGNITGGQLGIAAITVNVTANTGTISGGAFGISATPPLP